MSYLFVIGFVDICSESFKYLMVIEKDLAMAIMTFFLKIRVVKFKHSCNKMIISMLKEKILHSYVIGF